MRIELTSDRYSQQFAEFKRSAWRFEQQPAYAVDYERSQFERFLAGRPDPPDANPDLRSWFERVRWHASKGRTVGRVRIVDEPITDYQRWMRWMDRWNREAGETIDYLSRSRAREVGLLPMAGAQDWWLFDDERLVLMSFDPAGVRTRVELVEDELEVFGARSVREAAIRAARESADAPS